MENYNFSTISSPKQSYFSPILIVKGREASVSPRALNACCSMLLHTYRYSRLPPAHASLHTPLTSNTSFPFLLLFQYYEMSYGLNVEMHKQVSLPSRLHLNFKSSNRSDRYRPIVHASSTRCFQPRRIVQFSINRFSSFHSSINYSTQIRI